MNRHKLIEKICEICGRKFPARASDKRASRGRTCSFKCSGKLGGKLKGAHPLNQGAHPLGTDLASK